MTDNSIDRMRADLMEGLGEIGFTEDDAEALVSKYTRLVQEEAMVLADEWEQEADEDERWLNGPHVAVSEAREYPALIRQARQHASQLRALSSQSADDDESRVTKTNPSGEVRQCDRRDVHESHEYQAEFGAYFNVYCPGNDGRTP